jgi:cob(I)alamin adenosyltransferase
MVGLERGYTQVYTGDGKGKTTAALGLTLRAIGYNLKIFIAQFIKGMEYNEIKALREFKDNVTIKQYGKGCFIRKKPSETDIKMAENGLKEIKQVLTSGTYNIVILDEINVALHFNLIKVKDLVEIIKAKPEKVELILTGRKAKKEILEIADLVTEMKEIKHYYTRGVMAREGIEK